MTRYHDDIDHDSCTIKELVLAIKKLREKLRCIVCQADFNLVLRQLEFFYINSKQAAKSWTSEGYMMLTLALPISLRTYDSDCMLNAANISGGGLREGLDLKFVSDENEEWNISFLSWISYHHIKC